VALLRTTMGHNERFLSEAGKWAKALRATTRINEEPTALTGIVHA
jgi:hypothetical protein